MERNVDVIRTQPFFSNNLPVLALFLMGSIPEQKITVSGVCQQKDIVFLEKSSLSIGSVPQGLNYQDQQAASSRAF